MRTEATAIRISIPCLISDRRANEFPELIDNDRHGQRQLFFNCFLQLGPLRKPRTDLKRFCFIVIPSGVACRTDDRGYTLSTADALWTN